MKSLLLISALTIFSATAFAAPSKLVNLVKNDEAEVLLADSFSRTLYVFDLDQGTTTSKCTGDCAEMWPPYLISAEEAKTLSEGLGTITRANNKLQLTYEGRPLYTYSPDRAIGDDKGDDVGNVWHYVEIE
ncbi:MAG: hypothetical protein H7177_04115 [Rhizobacter sp.]|nr:hypothetical protein [Bacteriovorax sp.]